MTVTIRTGEDLLDLFVDARDDPEWRVADWLSAPPQVYAGMAMASATVPMHVREGIAVSGLSAGIVTAGTASGDESWAGRLVAARGLLRMLDSGRIDDDGVRRPVRLDEPAEPGYVLLHPQRVRIALDPAKVLGAVEFGLIGTRPARDPPVDRTPSSELAHIALALRDVPAAVEVERPAVRDLTDDSLENTRRLFALTVAQLADLFGVTERQMHRYLRDGVPENRRALADALMAVGLTVIGGLGARGARRWLYSGKPTAAELAQEGRIDKLTARAEALRDSPAT